MPGVLVDTNILVYAYQPGGSDPRIALAKRVLSERTLAGDGFVSVQNLAELSSVCLTKVKPPLTSKKIQDLLGDLEMVLSVLRPSADTVKSAVSAVDRHGLSFWDAMLWSIAKENGLAEILSEDLQDGQILEGVRFRNPLK